MSLPTETKVFILNEPPIGAIKPDTFKLKTQPIPELKDGQVLVKVEALSNEPAQRIWMDGAIDPRRLYTEPIKKGEPVRSLANAKVIASKSSKWPVGTIVNGFMAWYEYGVLNEDTIQSKAVQIPGLSPYLSLSAVGLTGLTAYTAVFGKCKLKPEQIVVVSGAAGAVGSVFVQLAKKVVGCTKVIGIAGGKEKCDWVKSLGADECIDYKDKDYKKHLASVLPDYADVYFDNVGGEILDTMLGLIKLNGLVVCCGAIAGYNGEPLQLKNWADVIFQRFTIQGFLFSDHKAELPKALEDIPKWIKDGTLDVTEGEDVHEAKFEDVPKIWAKLFSGGNKGKLITKLV